MVYMKILIIRVSGRKIHNYETHKISGLIKKKGGSIQILSDKVLLKASSENLGIKACDRDKSGVYTKVNEHFVEGSNAESGVFGGCLK